MASSTTSFRPYDILLLGATGYTGRYAGEHIIKHLPTNLKWAIAGRTPSKLQTLIDDTFKPLNPDRKQPEVELAMLYPGATSLEPLNELAAKTRVLVNCVGPYYEWSEPVVKACVEQGTHYLDCTGEVPWVGRMIKKYEEKAKETGTIVSTRLEPENISL